ncbi:PQQ-dependent sugar dehydrogenase, partial [Alphaproteobacteria bacterium]|nr:PQQ-dependent sugar dehydrogenase [Alphaproteobacteria bacterium]
AKINLSAKQLTGVETIFTSSIKRRTGRHFGSRIRFAPDKTLFVTLGDRGKSSRAQDPFDHAGSIIRINPDGSIPSDNPAFDGKHALPKIWSIGHRNPQGATIDPVSGALWTTSHGDAGGDEVNKPRIGRNYGWPLISYGKTYSGSGYKLGNTAPGFEQPKYYWDPSIAPSGLAFYDPPNPAIPSWKGSLLAGALRGELLSRLILKGEQIIAEERYLEGEYGRIRDIKVGPDGAVYLLTDDWDGVIVRLTEK